MSTEIALRQAPTTDLAVWAGTARDAFAIAEQLADTSFVPRIMFRKPGDVCGAILAGNELGLPPMSALRSIDIIDGSPAMRAVALRGLVYTHGHDMWIDEATETRAVVSGQRAGSTHVQTSTWTMDRAKRAELTGKKNWRAHPGAMLIARATAECARLVIPDVLIGMPYSIEELADGADIDGVAPPAIEPAPVAPVTTRKAAQRKPPSPVKPPMPVDDTPPVEPWPEPARAVEPEPADVPPVEPDTEAAVATLVEVFGDVEEIPREDADVSMISDPQRRRLAVGFKTIGVADRDERLAFASRVVGRDLTSSNDLTLVEATRVIGALIEAEQRMDPWAETAPDEAP